MMTFRSSLHLIYNIKMKGNLVELTSTRFPFILLVCFFFNLIGDHINFKPVSEMPNAHVTFF